MEFRVLGSLQVLDEGRPVTVAAPRQRALLADLLIHANEVVSTDRLIDDVWGGDGGEVGVSTLRYHVSKLRDALEPDRLGGHDGVIATQSPGYLLRAEPDQIDGLALEDLLGGARMVMATDPGRALELLDEALGSWKGPAYAEFAYENFARLEILRLEEKRLEAIEARFEALLALGSARDVVGELPALVAEHPHRERLTGALMLALYRSGRQADALAAFQSLRRELGEALGIEPSKELVDLEDKILLQDESLLVEAPAPTGKHLRGYALRGRIGEGAHGVVWRAAQPGVGREVAVKAIHPDIANRPGFVQRFEMEAQLVASLEHPHIVSLFDFWRDPEGAYLVMPYLRGGNVETLLGQGPLRPERALDLIRAIGGALAYAHRRGVVHRDVTPQNVLLDDDGNPYLADFGVATLIGESGLPTSSSPAYLSPEQHAGHGAFPQSDVYSLGVLTHALLTGQMPTLDHELAPVSALRPEVPSLVDAVIQGATAFDLADRFGAPEEFVADLSRSLGTASADGSVPIFETRNPYKGLRAFGETDAEDFFGRELLVTELVEAVARHRLVGVVGPSGCGKSSLVRAGFVPAIRRGAPAGWERWLVTDMYPGSQPFSELQAALLRVAVDIPENFSERLVGEFTDRRSLCNELLPPDTELLLIVDQFEELFTLTVDEGTRQRFLAVLAEIVDDPLNRVRVVVTLRADFYDRPLEYPEFGELLRSGLVSVTMPTNDSLARAISGPAERVDLEVDPGLAERITNDVAGQPGGLPLLEYALTELFQRRVESRLTLDGYESTGGVLGALGRRAEDLYGRYDEAGQRAAQQVFLRLVTVEEGTADTRRRIPLTELHGMGLDVDALRRVLDDYGSHRLLTFDRDPKTREPTVEVAHEALLSRWDRLRTWIDDRRDDLLLRRRLAASVGEWLESGREQEYLLSRGRLEHYEAFATETDIALLDDEREFLNLSREHTDALSSRRRRIRNAVLGGFAAAAIIAALLAVVAFAAQRQAEEEATIRRVAELSAQSRLANETDPELGILLALEAVGEQMDGAPLVEAVDTLHAAVMASRLRLTVPGWWTGNVDAGSALLVSAPGSGRQVTVYAVASGDAVLTLPVSGDASEGEIEELSAAISPDGSYIATGRSDGTVALWDAVSGEELFNTNDQQRLWTDASSGEFTLGYLDQTTAPIGWNAEATEIEAVLEALVGITDVAVGGQGTEQEPWIIELIDTHGPYTARLIADISGLDPDGAVMHIGARGHDYVGRNSAEYDGVYDVEFSPYGTVLASHGWDGTVRIWDVATGDERLTLDAPISPLNLRRVAFSPDGSLLVNAVDENVWVWEVSTGELAHNLLRETTEAKSAAFLPGGDQVVVAHDADEESALTVWNLDTGEVTPLPGKGSSLISVVVSSDGGTVVTGDRIGNVYVKALSEDGIRDQYDFRAHQIEVFDLMLSEDNLLVSSAEGETRVWDLGFPGTSEYLAIPSSTWLTTASYSPDGSTLAMPDVDGPVVMVDSQSGERLLELGLDLDPGTYQVAMLRFSPDGSALAAAVIDWESEETALLMWDTRSGELVSDRSLGEGALWDLDFSPDGTLIAGVIEGEVDDNWTHQVRVWDAASADEILVIDGSVEGWEARGAAFSSEGNELAVRGWSPDGATHLVGFYDLSGQRLRTCCEHHWEIVASIDYSPDGSLLVTSGFDLDSAEGTVELWDAATGDRVGLLPGHQRAAHNAIFSPDGSMVASASYGEIRIWDVATRAGLMTLLADGEDSIFGLSFSPDGSRIASTGESGLVRVWALNVDELIELARSRVFRTFTAAECEIYDIDPCPALE